MGKPNDALREVSVLLTDTDLGALTAICAALPNGCKILEVGSFLGGSAIVICGVVASRGGRLVCVDTWKGSEEDKPFWDTVRLGTLYEDFIENIEAAGVSHMIEIVRGNSQDAAVYGRFSDGEFDMAFIDGSHKTEDAYQDFCNYWAKVKPGGFMLAHDCLDGAPARKALEMFAESRPDVSVAFIPGSHGMAVMRKP